MYYGGLVSLLLSHLKSLASIRASLDYLIIQGILFLFIYNKKCAIGLSAFGKAEAYTLYARHIFTNSRQTSILDASQKGNRNLNANSDS